MTEIQDYEVGMTPVTALIRDMPEQIYHDGPCDGPELSSSIAKIMCGDSGGHSAAHAYLNHPKLGGVKFIASSEQDFGNVVHELMLGKGAGFEVLDFKDWRTKAAKEAREVAGQDGKVAILKHKHAALEEAITAIKNRLRGFGIDWDAMIETSEVELSAFWLQDEVQCKSRFDLFQKSEHGITITDLKTASDASLRGIKRSIAQFGYDLQSATYIAAVEHLFPDYVGRVKFQWVFVELARPHPVTPSVPSEGLATLGRDRWRQAVAIWKDCLDQDEWNAYVTETAIIQPEFHALRSFYEGDDEG